MSRNGTLLPAMWEGRELTVLQREHWKELGRNCQWNVFGKQNWGVCFGGRSLGISNVCWLGQGGQRWRMQAETKGNEKGEHERSFHSYCLSVCHKGVTEGRVFEHASRIGRGRGWWKNGGIGVGLIHHGDWRCLHTGADGFVLDKYYGSCMRVTKLL